MFSSAAQLKAGRLPGLRPIKSLSAAAGKAALLVAPTKLTLLWLLLRTLRDCQSCSALGTCLASKRLHTINRVASPLDMHLTPLGRPTGYGTVSVARSLVKPGGSGKQTASTTASLTPNSTSSSCGIHRLLENYSRQITQTGNYKPCCRYGNTESISCQACMVVLI